MLPLPPIQLSQHLVHLFQSQRQEHQMQCYRGDFVFMNQTNVGKRVKRVSQSQSGHRVLFLPILLQIYQEMLLMKEMMRQKMSWGFTLMNFYMMMIRYSTTSIIMSTTCLYAMMLKLQITDLTQIRTVAQIYLI